MALWQELVWAYFLPRLLILTRLVVLWCHSDHFKISNHGYQIQIRHSGLASLYQKRNKTQTVCRMSTAWNTTSHLSRDLWCLMFFNETSRSHQSTLLNSTHTGRQRKSEIQKARAKEHWPLCVCVCEREGESKCVKRGNVTSPKNQAHHEDQAQYIKRTTIQRHFIERFQKINHTFTHIIAHLCLLKYVEHSKIT